MSKRPKLPKVCGTCRKWEPESGICILWCRHTDSSATCEFWKLEDDQWRIPIPDKERTPNAKPE